MNKGQKLKIVTDDIRAKLPRLMELEKGCLIKNTYGKYKIINKKNNYFDCVDIVGTVTSYSEKYLRKIKGFEIIGKEPMLNDVLEWLRGKNHAYWGYRMNSAGELTAYDFYKRKWSTPIDFWDFSKPYLKDQSEKLINFLYELIKEG